MDFNKLKIATKVNTKTKSKTTTESKISLPIRKSSERSEVEKPKQVMKNFNISMYKQVYHFCDICDTEKVHIIKESSVNCAYCESSYRISYHNQYKVIPIIYVPLNNFIFI